MSYKFPIVIDACPACGSSDTVGKYLANIMQDKGWALKDFRFWIDSRSGVPLDKRREVLIPFGSKLPVIRIKFDVCMKCGCYYAVLIELGEATKQVALAGPDQQMPFSGN